MFNVSRRHVHETRSIRAHVQPRQLAHDLPPLMLDGKPILEHRNFTRKAGKRRYYERDDPRDGL
jgi:hypothetical protein